MRVSAQRLSPLEFRVLLGGRISELRIAQGATQLDIAQQLDISQSAFSRIEKGNSDCSVTRLHHIAELLGVKLTTLLEGLL